MIHRCPKMADQDDKPFLGSHQYAYRYDQANKKWSLQDKGNMQEFCSEVCKWCSRNLSQFVGTKNVRAGIDRNTVHRCDRMVATEHRRNEEKAHHKGDRMYKIIWSAEHGWALLNKGEPTKRRKLTECPFCRCGFPFLNQVFIE